MFRNIEEMIMRTCDLPTLPSVAEKVMRLVSEPETKASDLQQVIGADQALTARILNIANSAYYGRGRNVHTLSDAIMVIGFNALKSVVLMASCRNTYKKFGLTEKMLWEHSMGAAIAAGIIAGEAGLEDQEEAFVGGLLHDIGKVVLNNSNPQKFSDVMQKVYNEHRSFRIVEWELYGFSHTDVGALAIRKWKLPESLEMAVKQQYDPKWLYTNSYYMRLAAVINMSNQVCLKLGIGHREPVSELDLDKEEALEILGMDPNLMADLIEEIRIVYERERDMLSISISDTSPGSGRQQGCEALFAAYCSRDEDRKENNHGAWKKISY